MNDDKITRYSFNPKTGRIGRWAIGSIYLNYVDLPEGSEQPPKDHLIIAGTDDRVQSGQLFQLIKQHGINNTWWLDGEVWLRGACADPDHSEHRFYAIKANSPIAREIFNTAEDKTMKDHPFEIHRDGSVSYDGKTYEVEAVEELVEAVKNEIDETESHLGSFAGHQVKMLGPKYTHLKIGCQAFCVEYIKAFIEDYEAHCADPIVKLGDRVMRNDEEYIVAKDGAGLGLISLRDGNRWAAPIEVVRYCDPVRLSRLANHDTHFKIKE